jgi:hypothetical protein
MRETHLDLLTSFYTFAYLISHMCVYRISYIEAHRHYLYLYSYHCFFAYRYIGTKTKIAKLNKSYILRSSYKKQKNIRKIEDHIHTKVCFKIQGHSRLTLHYCFVVVSFLECICNLLHAKLTFKKI